MSKYLTYDEVEFANKALLIEALVDMGFEPIEGDSLMLHGYRGDKRPERAQVVIPREQLKGQANDIGFMLNERGALIPVISEFDAKYQFKGRFIPDLRTRYNRLAVAEIARRSRATQPEWQQDGSVLRARIRA